MQFKNFGASHLTSVALSIVVVFFATWALHAYQWFWLSGTMLFTLPDVLFWTILGLFLITQTLLENRPRPSHSAADGSALLGPRASLVVRTACTFLTICLLWSLWTSPSVSAWFDLLARSGLMPALFEPGTSDATQWLMTIAVAVLAVAIAAITAGVPLGLAPAPSPARKHPATPEAPAAFFGSIGVPAAFVAALLVVQIPAVSSAFGPRVQQIAEDIGESRLNAADAAMLDRGYYEGLTAGNRFNPELWDFYMAHPQNGDDAHKLELEGKRTRDGYLDTEFIPNSTATLDGKTYQINRWGMLDQDYPLEKSAHTYRVAMIGASRAMGWGVNYEDRFETLLERRLNDEPTGGAFKHYEILNFSMGGTMPMERLLTFEEKALPFRPDAILYEAGKRDIFLGHHAQMVRRGVAMPYEFLNVIDRKAGIDPSMSESEIVRRLYPYRYELASQIYNRFGEIARQHGMPLVWIYVPAIMDDRVEIDELQKLAEAAGFSTLDLSKTYDPKTVRQSRWDFHPNEQGNRIIANAIYQHLGTLQKAGRFSTALAH
jgi:hypothetical protein